MCRIAGIIDPSVGDLKRAIVCMRDAMQHGGPDDEGVYLDPDHSLALGHRRLALIDLSPGGHQPMADANGALQLIFNGEIYNFRELKTILKSYGHHFVTESDTEVILKAYQQWDTECFSYFEGMFALALWDSQKRQLILARDHAGIKPLYYYQSGDTLYFASEIRAFHSLPQRFQESDAWQTYFLAFGYLPEPITTLKNVHPVPSGTALVFDLPSLRCRSHRFSQFHFTEDIRIERDAIELVRQKMEQAVKRHLIADAPIGLFLSGGIDSSLLTILAKKYHGEQLHTLSIVFEEASFSEKPYQDIIIQQTNALHQSFLVTRNDFYRDIPDILQAMDQPSIDGINTYFISRYARQVGLKAVLSGLGADELFGGYPSFQLSAKLSLLQQVPSALLHRFEHSRDYRLKKLSFASFKNTIGEYLVYRGNFPPSLIAGITGNTEAAVIAQLNALQAFYPDAPSQADNKISWLETLFYMQSQLLKDTDYMSMWQSIEIRVPFLDRLLMNVITQVHPSIKYRKDLPKYLLIKAFEKELPEAIWKRKKQGFTFPFAQWLKGSAFIQPENAIEAKFYQQFTQDKLSWGRYWSVLLMNRFQQPAAVA